MERIAPAVTSIQPVTPRRKPRRTLDVPLSPELTAEIAAVAAEGYFAARALESAVRADVTALADSAWRGQVRRRMGAIAEVLADVPGPDDDQADLEAAFAGQAEIDDAESAEYAEGYDAYREGTPVEACPYDDDTTEASGWTDGWRDAHIDAESPESEEEEP